MANNKIGSTMQGMLWMTTTITGNDTSLLKRGSDLESGQHHLYDKLIPCLQLLCNAEMIKEEKEIDNKER